MEYRVTINNKYENLVGLYVIDIPDDRLNDHRYIMDLIAEISSVVRERRDYHITKIEPA
jgi:hypothetical protein